MPRNLSIAAFVVGGFLAAPAAAPAAQVLFGSDLAAPADVAESSGANTILWNDSVATERPGPPGEPLEPHSGISRRTRAGAPRDGQLRYVTIFGSVPPGGTPVRFHFVVLRPQADGTTELAQVEASQIHVLPVSANPRNRVPNKSVDWDLCLEKGDRLGVLQLDPGSLRVFATVPGSSTGRFESPAAVLAGNVFSGTRTEGRELLMEVLLNTGPDASSRCAGGYSDHVYRGLDFAYGPARLEAGTHTLRLKGRCPSSTYGGCTGKLRLRARIGGHTVTLGHTRFNLAHGHAAALRVAISAAHAAVLRSRGSTSGAVLTTGHDDPTDPRNRNAPGTRPGRQSGAFVLPLTIRNGS